MGKVKLLSETDNDLKFWMREWEQQANVRGKWTKRLEKDQVEMAKSMPDMIGKLTLDSGYAHIGRPDPNSISSRKTLRRQYKLSHKEKTLLADVKVPKYK